MHENQIQSRKWLLTINTPLDHGMTHDEIIDRAQKFNPDYVCLADEIGESGTYHTHVFLYPSSPMRFGTVKKRFPTAHIDKANGTAQENRAYIRKEGKWAESRKSETSVEGTFKVFGDLPDEVSEKSPKYAKLLQCVKDLILATQRPDANILSGQIKNNMNSRICGRADIILSQIILDSTAAAEQIPKDARGRFLLHDGTLFQAYWFDDANL